MRAREVSALIEASNSVSALSPDRTVRTARRPAHGRQRRAATRARAQQAAGREMPPRRVEHGAERLEIVRRIEHDQIEWIARDRLLQRALGRVADDNTAIAHAAERGVLGDERRRAPIAAR